MPHRKRRVFTAAFKADAVKPIRWWGMTRTAMLRRMEDLDHEGTPGSGAAPLAGFLSNGSYTVMLTASGTGFSVFQGQALTLWRGDRVEDADGIFLYLRDCESRVLWSMGRQPVPVAAGSCEACWVPGRFLMTRVEEGIEARLEICVPPETSAELRRVTLINRSDRRRSLDLASMLEVVLHDPAAHAAHPAFSKLFLQTESVPAYGALLARRRSRAPGEAHPWMVHALLGTEEREFETDRVRFLGRGRSLQCPAAFDDVKAWSGTAGDVLDPILSLRCRLLLEPGERIQRTFVIGAAPGREEALALLVPLLSDAAVEDAFVQAEVRAKEQLRVLGIEEDRARSLQALAGAVLYNHPGLRAEEAILRRARGSRSRLRAYGIAPHRRLVVATVNGPESTDLYKEAVIAQRYWRSLGLPIDVVVLAGNDGAPGGPAEPGTPGDPRILFRSQLAKEDTDLLLATAQCVLARGWPDLAAPAQGVARRAQAPREAKGQGVPPETAPADPGAGLRLFNGTGGFSEDGREYVIRLRWSPEGRLCLPPRPWINVIANERFGFLVSETGAGMTWSRNSRQNRLTPWSNDPLRDPHGEALYLRDEESGAFWSPLPGPVAGGTTYEIHHGFGVTECRHAQKALEEETVLFVPREDPVKIIRLRLANRGTGRRKISLYSYQRLVLGAIPEESGRFVVTESRAVTHPSGMEQAENRSEEILTARNPLAEEFSDGIVFSAVVADRRYPASFTTDRSGFIGRGGNASHPAALHGTALDGRTGIGCDPCFARQISLDLAPGQTAEISFLLGEARTEGELQELVSRYRKPGAIEAALREAEVFWQGLLSRVQIHTPDPALDLMVNGWLLYQVLSCRIWGRSALYQSGGAFGFRDQLQDCAALIHTWPEGARRQILKHAAHQFVQGDVLHWWHPPLSRGLRTRFADDLVWLPFLTSLYLRTTGDWGILEEMAPFLSGRALEEGEDEAFLLPQEPGESADLYEHCARALDRSLTRGEHGLPLFGAGDWNDGMNRVGHLGKGESVWMGFFLYQVLGDFLPVCRRRGDARRIRSYQEYRDRLPEALNGPGWDGGWYLRGYYDNGAPLGSKDSDECRIDALVQAWAVLSGGAPEDRAALAMSAAERLLVSEKEGLIRLLTPPFVHTVNDPGYIKGYLPGVRENGGQYTHAAVWFVQAAAQMGLRDKAARWLGMLSPAARAQTAEQTAVYQCEPYVIAADIYGEPPHAGRGGWSWYTGAAGWFYRVALESILGFQVEQGRTLVMRPCVPDDWPEFHVRYRVPGEETAYHIRVTRRGPKGGSVIEASLDGAPVPVREGAARIPLERDGARHDLEVILGQREDRPS